MLIWSGVNMGLKHTDIIAFVHQQRTAGDARCTSRCILPAISALLVLLLWLLVGPALVTVSALSVSVLSRGCSIAALLLAVAALLLAITALLLSVA
jgi:hypothetical protein